MCSDGIPRVHHDCDNSADQPPHRHDGQHLRVSGHNSSECGKQPKCRCEHVSRKKIGLKYVSQKDKKKCESQGNCSDQERVDAPMGSNCSGEVAISHKITILCHQPRYLVFSLMSLLLPHSWLSAAYLLRQDSGLKKPPGYFYLFIVDSVQVSGWILRVHGRRHKSTSSQEDLQWSGKGDD